MEFDYERKAMSRCRAGIDYAYAGLGTQTFDTLEQRLFYDERWCRQMSQQTKAPGWQLPPRGSLGW